MSRTRYSLKINFKSGNFWISIFLLLALGCQKELPENQSSLSTSLLVGPVSTLKSDEVTKVTLDKVILRLENEAGSISKIAEVKFNFYGSPSLKKNFEEQKSEIRNLILIHFANSNFKKLPEKNLNIKDPKLSSYLNQFLSSGQIHESEYQLVRLY